jgi:hypothetical protein
MQDPSPIEERNNVNPQKIATQHGARSLATCFFPDIYERITFDREELPADHDQELLAQKANR